MFSLSQPQEMLQKVFFYLIIDLRKINSTRKFIIQIQIYNNFTVQIYYSALFLKKCK